MVQSSDATLSTGLRKQASGQASRVAFPQSISCALCATPSTGHTRCQKYPLFAAFVDLSKAYDSMQHPSSEQPNIDGADGKMLLAIQSLYRGGAMSMRTCGRAGATSTARVGLRQECPLSPAMSACSLTISIACSSQAARQQVLSVEAPAFTANSMPMTLHCSWHRHRDCSSFWTPCNHSAKPMASPSASSNERLWSLVGYTMIGPGRGPVKI